MWCANPKDKVTAWVSAATCWLESEDFERCLEAVSAALDLKPDMEALKMLRYLEQQVTERDEEHAPGSAPKISPRAFKERRRKAR